MAMAKTWTELTQRRQESAWDALFLALPLSNCVTFGKLLHLRHPETGRAVPWVSRRMPCLEPGTALVASRGPSPPCVSTTGVKRYDTQVHG